MEHGIDKEQYNKIEEGVINGVVKRDDALVACVWFVSMMSAVMVIPYLKTGMTLSAVIIVITVVYTEMICEKIKGIHIYNKLKTIQMAKELWGLSKHEICTIYIDIESNKFYDSNSINNIKYDIEIRVDREKFIILLGTNKTKHIKSMVSKIIEDTKYRQEKENRLKEIRAKLK